MSVTCFAPETPPLPSAEEENAATTPSHIARGPAQPLVHLPTWTKIRIATKQRALFGRGGDFFEVFQHRDGSVSTVMADVCGNGPAAAVPVSELRWVLRQHLARGEAPGVVLAAVNEWLVNHKVHDRFVTAVCARVNAGGGRAEVATAGHLGPFVKRASGTVESLATTAGLPLGIFPQQVYEEISLALYPEDAIVLVTDGITDRLASAPDPLGQEALRRFLSASPHTAAHICDALLGSCAPAGQDATVVVLQLPPRHRRNTPVPL